MKNIYLISNFFKTIITSNNQKHSQTFIILWRDLIICMFANREYDFHIQKKSQGLQSLKNKLTSREWYNND